MYTSIGPPFPPAKMAPKSKIRIIGKTREKKSPILVLVYPRAKSFRSARILVALANLVLGLLDGPSLFNDSSH